MRDQRLFWIWSAMRQRCNNPNDKGFKNYGGRGIKVCKEWGAFANFLRDMGPRPAGGMLDRTNNDGNYEPGNCRWTTRKEQNGNRRNCIYVEVAGATVSLKEACRRLGLKYRPIHKRIVSRGWEVTRALSTPIGIGNTHEHS